MTRRTARQILIAGLKLEKGRLNKRIKSLKSKNLGCLIEEKATLMITALGQNNSLEKRQEAVSAIRKIDKKIAIAEKSKNNDEQICQVEQELFTINSELNRLENDKSYYLYE
ncbi:TPA: hypothetical protein ACPVZG_000173 [Vibrio parahaemolyticus]